MASIRWPVKELKGFARISLEPGVFEILIGPNSNDVVEQILLFSIFIEYRSNHHICNWEPLIYFSWYCIY